MPKLLAVAAVVLLLDVFPGRCGGGANPPSTLAGPCQTTCDCDPTMNAPIRCPGQWECNADQRCEYSCGDDCLEDGGCADTKKTCTGVACVTSRATCP